MSTPPSSPRTLAAARPWLTAVALVLILVLAILGEGLARWASAALLLGLVPTFAERFEPLQRHSTFARWTGRLGDRVPLLVLIAVAVALLGELALGHPPASRDHAIHYFQTHILVDELVPAGKLRGWSDAFNSGYPFGDNYPVLGYLWVGALHLVSFGAISLRASYAFGLLGIWALALWGVWKLAAMVYEEIGERREDFDAEGESANAPTPALRRRMAWAGCIAALLWLIDPGASREGGWTYLMFHGVWPQMLSSALWIASLPLTFRALRRPSPRALALPALMIGGSVLAHPFGLLTSVCSLTAWPVVLWATGSLRRLPSGALRWIVIVHVLAGLLALWWVLGFLGSADSMDRSPVTWHTLGALAAQVVRGELFEQHVAWVGPLAVAGLVVAVRRGRALAWLTISLLAGMLVLASEASVTVLRLDLVVSAFKNLQFPRYAIALKPLWCVLAGIGGSALIGMATRRRDDACEDDSKPARRRLGVIALAVLCFGPLLAGVVEEFDRLAAHPVGRVHSLEGSAHEAPERAIEQVLRGEAERLGEQPMTVAFLRHRMGGGTYPLFAITDVGARVALDGHVPAVNYRHQLKSRTPKALRSLGVTHVIWDRELESRDRALAANLEEIEPPEGRSFGRYHVGRLVDPQFSRGPRLRGNRGRVEVVEHDSERRTYALSDLDVEDPGILDLVVGPYPRWVVRDQDGKLLETRPAKLDGGVPGIAVTLPPGPRSRTITLEYEQGDSARWSVWVSAAALLLCLLSCVSNRRLDLADRVHPPIVRRITWVMSGLASVLVIGLLWQRTERQLVHTWEPVVEDLDLRRDGDDQEPPTLDRDLAIDGEWRVRSSNPRTCDPMLGRDALVGCTDAAQGPRVSLVYRRPYLYRCVRVHVPAHGSLDLRFEDLDPDATVVGFVARLTSGRSGGDGLEFRASGKKRFTRADKRRRRLFHSEADDHDGTVTVELTNDFAWSEDVCIAAATVK